MEELEHDAIVDWFNPEESPEDQIVRKVAVTGIRLRRVGPGANKAPCPAIVVACVDGILATFAATGTVDTINFGAYAQDVFDYFAPTQIRLRENGVRVIVELVFFNPETGMYDSDPVK